MMKRSLLLALALSVLPSPSRAEEKIKLGTLAPSGSTWHTLLKEMGQKWSEASGGKVKLIIYPGGVVGNEGDMVKKTRIGQLQGAALTSIGLHEITPEPQAVDVPFMIDSFDELDYVMERIGPKLEKSLEAKGYVVIGWAEIGFVRFFSTKKYQTMADFTGPAKVFGWEGDPASNEAWRAGGFKPVVMSSTDITARIFEKAKYMLDMKWAILTGATIVRKDAWEKIPAELRPKLLEIAKEYSKKIAVEVRKLDDDALKTMKTQGLVPVTPVDPPTFEKAARATWTIIRGKVVPATTFDEVKALAEEYKASHPGTAAKP